MNLKPALIPEHLLTNIKEIVNIPSRRSINDNIVIFGIISSIILFIYLFSRSDTQRRLPKQQTRISIIPSKYVDAETYPNPTEGHYPQPQLHPDKLNLTQPDMQPYPPNMQINPEHYIHEQNQPMQPVPNSGIQTYDAGASYCPVNFETMGSLLTM